MSDKSTALGAMRQLFQQVEPAPNVSPVGVWLYPSDYESITTEVLPMVIINELINNQNQWRRNTHHDSSQDIWTIEAMVFLYNGPITKASQAAAAEALHRPWPGAVAAMLYKNQRLFNQVFQVAELGTRRLFDYQIGQINWWNKAFWGVRFIFPIVQSISH